MDISNQSGNRRLALLTEAIGVTLLVGVVIGVLAYQRGYFSWSWDAINHHVYLGYIAQSSRWHLDLTAAASQSYQYPYLYWPAYRISLLSGNGALFAAWWAGIQAALLALPLWLVAYRLQGDTLTSTTPRIERLLAVALGVCSAPVLAAFGTTANDALAALPVLWAAALGFARADQPRKQAVASALLGVGIACKLSNVIYLPLLIAFAWVAPFPRMLRRSVLLGAAMLVGFALAYLPWGWQLWQQMGNPFYPYLQGLFRP